ncbi:uncharacterized protein LOC114718079 [Neltuma alba]|uniref:uncharacterized protein LOC114718079 n=1 Tax=Neltuma alba TaxID=207710 RepID=UPI0010A4D154|nr:uncharacterized protein LOC114718079 [Prosopis alba]
MFSKVKRREGEGDPEEMCSASTLTVKTSSSKSTCGADSHLTSPNLKNSMESTPYDSPCLVSPSSSAFVSALQSPHISPRQQPPTTVTHPSPPFSYRGSQSEDIPSSSYTPPSDPYEFSDDTSDTKLKFVTCVPVPDPIPPRISFSFPVPRTSFAKSSFSAASNAKLTSCDVYIGFHGHNPNLIRFCKWLKSELELQGIDCFSADRAKYSDSQSHEIADRVICSVTFGLVVVTPSSFINHCSMEEIRFFVQKKNLIPLFFEASPTEVMALADCNSINKECTEALDGVMQSHELKLEAIDGNWGRCIMKAAGILRSRLGRKREGFENKQGFESLPFPRNAFFGGREKEIMEIESLFFGNGNCPEQGHSTATIKGEASGQSEGLADEESDHVNSRGGRFICLEMDKSRDSTFESWVDVEPLKGKNSFKRKQKKSRSGNYKSLSSTVICINGVSGIGKSELALEFAYRFYQRYKMVLWVGGEARYLRQNILNLSLHLGVDVGADSEVERGGTRSFEEQETEVFKRIKRELFSDMPYLLIIDNLESEEDWWEGKNMHDLIPRNTGGTHVIITSRLSKVMNYDTIELPPLPLSDAMMLIRGRKKREYPSGEVEFLKTFNKKLGRLSFGLWLIGSLLSELGITPSALFGTIDQIPLEEDSPSCYMSIAEEQHLRNNPFLKKILEFSFGILEKSRRKQNFLAKRMLLVSGWLAPSPISASLLASAANSIIPRTKTLDVTFNCLSSKAWKSENDSAMLLVKLGLARIASKNDEHCIIHFHPITQAFAKKKGGLQSAKAIVQGVTRKTSNPYIINADHFWASAFLVFGFKSEPPLVQLQATDMVLYIKRTALPLAIQAFSAFSRCNSAMDLLKVCTDALEEAEKSFVSQIQDWSYESICWKRRLQRGNKVDEYVWQEVTLLKATLLETRAKLLARGGLIDSGKELCRTCISIRTVMLGHNHAHTLAAQDTLARLVRMRRKI